MSVYCVPSLFAPSSLVESALIGISESASVAAELCAGIDAIWQRLHFATMSATEGALHVTRPLANVKDNRPVAHPQGKVCSRGHALCM